MDLEANSRSGTHGLYRDLGAEDAILIRRIYVCPAAQTGLEATAFSRSVLVNEIQKVA